MDETQMDGKRLTDLKEVYDILQKDAREMSIDLLGGVTMWRSASIICFILAALAITVGIAVGIYVGFVTPPIFKADLSVKPVVKVLVPGGLKLGIVLITSFLFGVGAASAFAGAYYLRKYYFLRRKYSDLRTMLKKLS